MTSGLFAHAGEAQVSNGRLSVTIARWPRPGSAAFLLAFDTGEWKKIPDATKIDGLCLHEERALKESLNLEQDSGHHWQ
jgi:hypothetical protein